MALSTGGERKAKTRRAKRAWLRSEKTRLGCAACGMKPEAHHDLRTWHFHHLRDKLYNISRACHDLSWALLRAEVAKCEVRCVGCHEDVTYHRH